MGLRIQNNIAALNAHRWLSVSDTNMSKSMERLSSGYRINRAADDAAGLSISQSFRAEIASLRVASRNISEGNSLLQVAEGAVDAVSNILIRLKELATQSASANAGSDRDKISAEKKQLTSELGDIVTSTKYAGKALIDGTFTGTFQVGAENATNNQIKVTLGNFKFSTIATNSAGTGVAASVMSLSTASGARTAMDIIGKAIDTVNLRRGDIGAQQNRMGYASANISISIENKQASESVIRDVDMAFEMVTFTKNQILLQAGTAMLGQANMAPQSILSLLK
jgi:flagellin